MLKSYYIILLVNSMFTLLKILPLLLQQSSQIVYVESDVWTLRYVYKQVEYRQFFFIQALIMLMFFFFLVERHFTSTFYIKVLDSCIITYWLSEFNLTHITLFTAKQQLLYYSVSSYSC